MHECFWKTEQSWYVAGLPNCAFQRIAQIGNLKRNIGFHYIYQWMLLIMNNYQLLFIIITKSDYCNEIYHIHHCLW
jgi:hypothetical protein